MQKLDVLLKGLHCVDCASKIEEDMNRIDGITANFNFMNQIMHLEFEPTESSESVLYRLEGIVLVHEHEVEVIPLEEQEEKKRSALHGGRREVLAENKVLCIRLFLGTILFLIANFALRSDALRSEQIILYILSYIVLGLPIILKAIKGIGKASIFNEYFLMSIATIGALVIGEYQEAVLVMLFYLIGEFLQELAVGSARSSIHALLSIQSQSVHYLQDGKWIEVPTHNVKKGDSIRVLAGERIPLDGIVKEGQSNINYAAISGESTAKVAEIGDTVLSGGINLDGSLIVEVEKVEADSTAQKMVKLVQDASKKKAKTETAMRTFTKYYTPVVVFLALGLFLIPTLISGIANYQTWLYRALVFLVISCPCAFIVSVPLTYFAGIGGASKRGILVKASQHLESLASIDTVVFDKTGTLTEGRFAIASVIHADESSEAEVLAYAKLAERYSKHPIANAIVAFPTEDQNLNLEVLETEEIPGRGIILRLAEGTVYAGNRKLLEEANIILPEEQEEETSVYIARNSQFLGLILLEDQIKTSAKESIEELTKLGVENTVMLTGDKQGIADKVAKVLGIQETYAELLPAQKVALLEDTLNTQNLKKNNGKVLAVGDGINDAALLARADIGLAMGADVSDAAIEAADVVLLEENLHKLVQAIRIGKRTRRIVWQNIAIAFFVKAFFLLLAAFGISNMFFAVLADVGVTVVAVLNAMRALYTEKV